MGRERTGRTEGAVEAIAEAAAGGHGFVDVSTVYSLGVTSQALSRMVASGAVMRLAYGLYGVPGVECDPYALLSARFPRGAFSHGSALYLHGLAGEPDGAASMTFPSAQSSAAHTARRGGVDAHKCSDDVSALGLGTAPTPLGATVPAHGPERAICDLAYRRASPDLAAMARGVSAYLHAGGDRGRLLETARSMGVDRVVEDVVTIVEGGVR